MKKTQKFIEKMMEKEISLTGFVFSFLGVLLIRVFAENFIAINSGVSIQKIVLEYIHDLYFFSIAFLLLWIFLSFILKINPKKLACFFLWGTWLILLPPILDMLITKGAVFWSFYVINSPEELFKNFRTFFGDLPSGIVYFGTKISFFLAIISIGTFVFLKTRSYIKTILSLLFSYSILFFMGAFPTFFYFLYNFLFGSSPFSEIKSIHIAQFFGLPRKIFGVDPQIFNYSFVYNLNFIYYVLLIFLLITIFFIFDKRKLRFVFLNSRFPQVFYHGGLFFMGMGLGYLNHPQNFQLDVFSIFAVLTLLLSIFLAWVASVVPNDIYDLEIDKITNSDRPLPQKIFTTQEYINFGVVCFLLSILGAISVGLTFFSLIIIYQILAWFYSSEPFRLKKFPIIATLVSSLASLMVLFLGYILFSSDQSITNLSWRITLLLMIAYTISLPIKDFKDIEGDKKYEIWTIPVIFGEKKGRLIIAINLFISYMLSVFFLNEPRLFIWAVIFGSATFLSIVSEKTKPRQMFWRVLGLAFIYGLFLVKISFIA